MDSDLLQATVFYARHLSEDRLKSASDYLRFLYEQDRPLDAFDYELAAGADNEADPETVPFEAALRQLGLTDADLQN
ncbi:MAG TPA: hypothetical protein PK770_03825 [Kiritimatiellia bacterium]|jgi:hypothetical protein|nr:hypothetical protein [Kiritimatiellia bacterium]